jgi:hypothetical protein
MGIVRFALRFPHRRHDKDRLGQREALCSGRRAEDNAALKYFVGRSGRHAPLNAVACAIVPRGL